MVEYEQRVESRNAQPGDFNQLPFDVSRETTLSTLFRRRNKGETLWEPPTDEELAACNGVTGELGQLTGKNSDENSICHHTRVPQRWDCLRGSDDHTDASAGQHLGQWGLYAGRQQ
jgi:hypothetical protein